MFTSFQKTRGRQYLPIGTLPNTNVNQINEYIHKDLKDRPYFEIILKIIKQEY